MELRNSLISKSALTNQEIAKKNSTIDLYSSKIRKLEDERSQLTTDLEDYKNQCYIMNSKMNDLRRLQETNAD